MEHLIKSLYQKYHKICTMGGRIKRKIQLIRSSKEHALKSVIQFAQENGCTLLPAGKIEHTFFVDPPIFDSEGYHAPGKTPTISPTNLPYVAELSDAVIYSKSNFIIVGKNALNDTVTHPKYGSYVDLQYDCSFHKRKNDKIYLSHSDYPVEEHEGGILLSGPCSEAFGHWPNEFLPRLEFLEYHPDFKKLPIIVDEGMPQSHFDYLEFMTSNPVFRLPAQSGLRCKKLLVAPTPSFIPHWLLKNHPIPICERAALSPERFQFMRDRVYPKVTGKSSYGPKIYLSRRNCTWRRLLNELEIEEFLRGQGFEIVHVEIMSFPDQVRMFREARHIVAANGSSLLNLIYAPRDVKLFILSQFELNNWGSFYGSMNKLGYDMLFVLGDEKDEYIHADYRLPVERLRDALALIH